MTYRALLIFVGVSALALAGLALVYTIRAIVRRARAGRPRVWRGLFFREILITGLLVVGMSSLGNLPPPQMVNHPAPAADEIVAFIQTPHFGNTQAVVGASARDGAARWRQTFDDHIESLRSLSPDILLVSTGYRGLYALRAADGAVLWHSQVANYGTPATIVADAARIYALAPAAPPKAAGAEDVVALDLQTGALAWRVPLPASVAYTKRLAVGDGLVFVAGQVADARTTLTPWIVVALRATDGAPQWAKAGVLIPGSYAQVQAMFVMHGYAIVVPAIGPVTALRESDGATAWTGTPNLEESDNPPQIFAATADSDTLYVMARPSHWTATGANGVPLPTPTWLVAMDIGGTMRWRVSVQLPSTMWTTLAMSDGVLLSGLSVDESNGWAGYSPLGSVLTAYDAASGRPLWRDNTPPTGVSWDMSPEISPWGGSGAAYLIGLQTDPYVQDRFTCVIFCPGVSWLYAVNAHTGEPWWRVRTGDATITRPFFVF